MTGRIILDANRQRGVQADAKLFVLTAAEVVRSFSLASCFAVPKLTLYQG